MLCSACCAARKEALAAAGKAQLDLIESARKLYLKARAVTLAQRAKLYALDELDMATMRLRSGTVVCVCVCVLCVCVCGGLA